MTEIKQEPLDENDIEDIEIKKEVQEVVEVTNVKDIKLEPVVQDIPEISEDENLDDIDITDNLNEALDVTDEKNSDPDSEISDDKNDSDFNPELNSELEDIEVNESENEDIEVNESEHEDIDVTDENDKVTKIELNGMTIVQKGSYSKCPKCKKFIKSTFILRHIKLHDAKVEKFTCPEHCSVTFAKINNMFRHLKNVHKSKEPFVCKHCGTRFTKSKPLAKHLAWHRAQKRQAQEDLLDQDDPNDLDRYTCEFPGCQKSYGKKHHLKEHERKHTGDMKYKCEVCGKKFYMHAHMKRHMYSHTGLKPHVCRWKCGLTFASYGGRMKHERINHYEENPLESECDVCGRPFKNQQQLVISH